MANLCVRVQIEEEPATGDTVTKVEDTLPHLRIKTTPVTQESVRNLIALSKNMPDEVGACWGLKQALAWALPVAGTWLGRA